MKITQDQQKQAQEFYREIIAKAWEDDNFKQELISNPKEAIEKLTRQELNLANKIIKVVDQTDPSIVFINIPQNVNVDDLELTEEQLEMASGGFVITAALVMGAIGLGIALYGATH
jgi:hypothetical protein